MARFVESKRTSGKMGDRRRAARHQFVAGPREPETPLTDEKDSRNSISDDIFGEPSEPLAPPVGTPLAAPQPPEDPGSAEAEDPGSAEAAPDHPEAAAVLDPAKPVSSAPAARPALPDRPSTPSAAGSTIFIAGDGTVDLDAAAAKLGINTHKG